MKVLVVCGSPRSSTTWIHNMLIDSEQYFGIKANDREFKNYFDERVVFSDEDWFLTSYGLKAKHSVFHKHYHKKFSKRMKLYESQFSCDGQLMYESPYYVFLLDMFFDRYKEKLSVLYMKRDPHDVAMSMIKHHHLSTLLKKPLMRSCDFYTKWRNPVELRYAQQSIIKYANKKYKQLSLTDRAIVKWHCFDHAFFKLANEIGFSYHEFNVSSPTDKDLMKLGKFCGLPLDFTNKISSQFNSVCHGTCSIDKKLKYLLNIA